MSATSTRTTQHVIAACGVSRRAFWRDCGAIFDDAATRIFGTFEVE